MTRKIVIERLKPKETTSIKELLDFNTPMDQAIINISGEDTEEFVVNLIDNKSKQPKLWSVEEAKSHIRNKSVATATLILAAITLFSTILFGLVPND